MPSEDWLDEISVRRDAIKDDVSRGTFLGGLVASTVSGITGLVGAKPSAAAEQFRLDYPALGFASSLGGGALPYIGAYRLSQAPKIAKYLDSVHSAAGGLTRPIRSGLVRETLRFAPVEFARLGTGAFVAEDYGELFADVALSLGVNALFGGAVGFFEGAGKKVIKERDLIPDGVDPSLRPTWLYRAIKEKVAGTPEEALYQPTLDRLRKGIIEHEITNPSDDYVRQMEWGGDEQGSGRYISSLFKPGNKKSFRVRKLDNEQEWLQLDKPFDAEAFEAIQFPRFVETTGGEGTKRVRGLLKRQLTEVAPDTWMGKQAGGLFVVVKRLRKGLDPDFGGFDSPPRGAPPKPEDFPAPVLEPVVPPPGGSAPPPPDPTLPPEKPTPIAVPKPTIDPSPDLPDYQPEGSMMDVVRDLPKIDKEGLLQFLRRRSAKNISNEHNFTADLKDFADYVARTAPSAAQRVIARRSFNRIKELEQAGLRFGFKARRGGGGAALGSVSGSWIGDTPLYVLNYHMSGLGNTYETALHEIVHTATGFAIAAGRVKGLFGHSENFPELVSGSKELTNLYKAVAAHIKKPQNIAWQKYFGTANTFQHEHELVAWGLTHVPFQKFLASMPYKSETGWSKFKGILRKLLGLSVKEGSALDELLRITDKIYKAPVEELSEARKTLSKLTSKPVFQKLGTKIDEVNRLSDEYVVFQTSDPGRFAPVAQRYRDLIIEQSAFQRSFAQTLKGGDIYSSHMRELVQMLDYRDFGTQKGMERNAKRLLGNERLSSYDSAVIGLKDALFEFFTPTQYQGSRDWIWGRSLGVLRAVMDRATSFAEIQTHGQLIKSNKNAWKYSTAANVRDGVVDPSLPSMGKLFDEVGEDAMHQARLALFSEIELADVPKMVEAGEISKETARAIDVLSRLDEMSVRTLREAHRAAGKPDRVEFLKTYATRLYRGAHRTAVVDANGERIALASGLTRAEAQKEAQQIAKLLEEKGIRAKEGDSFIAGADTFFDDPTEVLDPARRKAVKEVVAGVLGYRPRFFKQRTGLLGTPDFYKFKKDELLSLSFRALEAKHRDAALQLWAVRFGDEMTALQARDPVGYKTLWSRVDDLMGKQGQFSSAINSTSDRFLAPFLGKDSADKIVGALNSVVYQFQLGILNPTFAVLNVLTPIQTLLPHISFVLNDPLSARRLNSWIPIITPDGKIGQMSYPNPLKVMQNGWREMGNLDDEGAKALARAGSEGLLSPRLIEQYTGQEAIKARNLKAAFESGQYWEALKAVNAFMPQKSEELARTYTFVTSRMMGRDLLKLEGEALYQFAKRQTELTMFGMATADRARVMTGPLGNLFGLFKNWQMHYIFGLMQYAGVTMNKQLWSPLVWQIAATSALAGFGGTPVGNVVQGIHAWGNDESVWDNMRVRWGEGTGDLIQFGLPSLLGISLQASGSTPGTDIGRDVSQMFSLVHVDRARALGRAIGSSYDRWMESGESPMHDRTIRDQVIRAVTPRAFYRAIAITEGDYLRSLSTGYPVVRGLGPLHKTLYGMGFNPVGIERDFQLADRLWKDKELRLRFVQENGAALAAAQVSGNVREQQRIFTRVMREGPQELDSVLASAAARRERMLNQDVFSKFDPQRVEEISGGLGSAF